MKKKIFEFPFHTILFSIYPILFFYSKNVFMFSGPSVVVWPIILSVLGVIALIVIGGVFFKSIDKIAFVLSLLVLSIYSTGFIAEFVYGTFRKEHALLWAIGIVLIGILISIFVKKSFRPLTLILNLVAFILVMGPFYTLYGHYRSDKRLEEKKGVYSELKLIKKSSSVAPGGDSLPDVYYIILDAYSRSDVLKKYYHYDNEWFIKELEKRGFYVAKKSCSNYHQTLQSLATSTGGVYLQSVIADKKHKQNELFELSSGLFKANPTFECFAENGYKIYNIISGYRFPATQELKIADATLAAFNRSNRGWGNFMWLLTKNTLIRIAYRYNEKHNSSLFVNPFEWEAFSTDFQFFMLGRTPQLEGPKFIFSHIISPHCPLYYNKEGVYDCAVGALYNYELYPESGGYSFDMWLKHYPDQVNALNHKLLRTVDEILRSSSKPPVIIVQGDHGTRIIEPKLISHFPILNAYFVPEELKKSLYESISPVNSFRVLFNYLFAAKLELLPDRSYINDEKSVYGMRDVTDELLASQKEVFRSEY